MIAECWGKRRHRTYGTAESFLKWTVRRFRPDEPLGVYRCRQCHFYHIGHK